MGKEGVFIPRRSREGAWIEIVLNFENNALPCVAPVRERGLKSLSSYGLRQTISRSREGAWIEMPLSFFVT